MKKIIRIAVVVPLIVAGYFASRKDAPADIGEADLTPRKATTSSTKLIDQVREFPGLPAANLSAKERSSECKAAIESIETLPLNTLSYDLQNGRINLKGDCLFTTKNDIPLLQGFPEVCTTRTAEGQLSQDCVSKLFFYKALRIHHATIDQDAKGLSTEILINKFIGLLAEQGFASPSGLKLMRDVGSTLRERLPNSESAARAALIGYLADDNLPADQKQKYEGMLDEARRQFPENWEIYEMDLVRKKLADEKSYNDEIQRYYTQNPNSAIAAYHMGCKAWSAADKVGALTFFEAAKKIVPQDKRFADTYAKALSVTPPEKVCSVQFNFTPDHF